MVYMEIHTECIKSRPEKGTCCPRQQTPLSGKSVVLAGMLSVMIYTTGATKYEVRVFAMKKETKLKILMC